MKAFLRTVATKTLSGTTTSSNTALTGTVGRRLCRIYNSGTVIAFIATGNSGVTATVATGHPIPPGAVQDMLVAEGHTHIATITPTGTATVYVSEGVA